MCDDGRPPPTKVGVSVSSGIVSRKNVFFEDQEKVTKILLQIAIRIPSQVSLEAGLYQKLAENWTSAIYSKVKAEKLKIEKMISIKLISRGRGK